MNFMNREEILLNLLNIYFKGWCYNNKNAIQERFNFSQFENKLNIPCIPTSKGNG
jgi:hypothetical protein